MAAIMINNHKYCSRTNWYHKCLFEDGENTAE